MAEHTAPSRILDWGYRLFMRRNSTYIAFVLVGALAGERVFNTAMDSLWQSNNAGKLFKDVEKKYAGQGGGEDDE